MTDTLTQLLTDAVARHSAEDAIAKLVDEQIGKVMSSAVDRALRGYGDVGKQLEKMVENSLALPEGTSLPAYGHMVVGLAKAAMDNALDGILRERVESEMADLMALGRREIKLSEVVEALRKHAEEDMADRHGSSFTVLVEEPSSYASDLVWVHLDEEANKSKYECEIMFLARTKGGEISNLSFRRRAVKDHPMIGFRWMPDWARLIFAAYATGGTLIVDEIDFSTSIGDC